MCRRVSKQNKFCERKGEMECLIQRWRAELDFASAYPHDQFEDPPEIRDRIWTHRKK